MSTFALIDGNCFYASCERVFRPDLAGQAIVVLSNNDGCVVARSEEAKTLGVGMAVPYFSVRHLERRGLLTVFSSNYELYADLSRRMMQTIGTLVPHYEVYSIDECFAEIGEMAPPLEALGQRIRQRVAQWVGLPTCVGIGPSKTLAKFCNHLAKRYPTLGGVLDWQTLSPRRQARALASEPAAAVWGIGRKLAVRLQSMGIDNAYALSQADPALIRRRFGVEVERVVRELQGVACLSLAESTPPRQQLLRSRSFGQRVSAKEDLLAAIAHHTAQAAADLRRQGSVAGVIGVQLHTHRLRTQDAQYHPCDWLPLVSPSNDTLTLTRAATALLHRLYRPGFDYQKAGVMLAALESGPARQQDWLQADNAADAPLMAALDAINQRYGRGALKLGAETLGQRWQMRRAHLSPCYTTRFDQLPSAICG